MARFLWVIIFAFGSFPASTLAHESEYLGTVYACKQAGHKTKLLDCQKGFSEVSGIAFKKGTDTDKGTWYFITDGKKKKPSQLFKWEHKLGFFKKNQKPKATPVKVQGFNANGKHGGEAIAIHGNNVIWTRESGSVDSYIKSESLSDNGSQAKGAASFDVQGPSSKLNNNGLEAMTISQNGDTIYYGLERKSLKLPTVSIYRRTIASLKEQNQDDLVEYEYKLGRINNKQSSPKNEFKECEISPKKNGKIEAKTMGLVELSWISDNRLLSLERFWTGDCSESDKITYAQIFDVSLDGDKKLATKELVLDLNMQKNLPMDNFEAMALGPCNNGRKLLLLGSDDNENKYDPQTTIIAAFAIALKDICTVAQAQ